MSNLSILEKEIQALRMKQTRIEEKQRKENEEVWSRIKLLEQLAQENIGVDAEKSKLSPSALIHLNKATLRRGWIK